MTETTAPIDRMAEFRTQRAAQIASLAARADYLESLVAKGQARKLKDGRIQVTKGFDAGEVFQADGQPQTGLTVNANGVAEFYSSGDRPWHELGTYFPEGLHSAKAALTAAKLDKAIVTKRRAGWWDEATQQFIPGAEDMFLTVREDTMDALGQVGAGYHVIDNATAFAWMERLEMPFETVGSFRGGRRVFASMKLPESLEVNTSAGMEHIQLYVFGINHHDGQGGLRLGVAPYRIECGNTERLAVRNAVTEWSIKHTKNHELRLEEAEKSLGLVHKYARTWMEEENTLAATAVQKADIAQVIADIWPEKDDAGKRAENKAERRVLDIMRRLELEVDRTGGATAYALERAITAHLDHAGERRPRGDQKKLTPLGLLGLSLLEGSADEKKATAHKRIMQLVRR